jgi:hypothetical protein
LPDCLSVVEFASELPDCLSVVEFASELPDCLSVDCLSSNDLSRDTPTTYLTLGRSLKIQYEYLGEFHCEYSVLNIAKQKDSLSSQNWRQTPTHSTTISAFHQAER